MGICSLVAVLKDKTANPTINEVLPGCSSDESAEVLTIETCTMTLAPSSEDQTADK